MANLKRLKVEIKTRENETLERELRNYKENHPGVVTRFAYEDELVDE